jgi:hypothetical protein
MAQQLKDRDVFQHYDQIFFITHSAGGLVTKRMLDMLNTPAQVKLLKKVRCVLYISVPSNGSELAGLASWLSSNPQFKSLSPPDAADFLQAVETDWDQILRDRTPSSPFPMTFSAYEKLSTKGLTIVPTLYATQSDLPVMVFDKDHSDIVKPEDRSSDVYEWARSRLLDASARTPASPAPNRTAATGVAKSNPKETPELPPSVNQNCPGGICAGGDINGSPTIINPGPPPLILKVTSMESTSSEASSFSDKPGFIKTEMTIVPNQPVIAPFTIALDFDNPITEIGNTVKNVGVVQGGGPYRVGVHARDTVGTSIGPEHPLVVVVYSLLPVKLVGLPRVEY